MCLNVNINFLLKYAMLQEKVNINVETERNNKNSVLLISHIQNTIL